MKLVKVFDPTFSTAICKELAALVEVIKIAEPVHALLAVSITAACDLTTFVSEPVTITAIAIAKATRITVAIIGETAFFLMDICFLSCLLKVPI